MKKHSHRLLSFVFIIFAVSANAFGQARLTVGVPAPLTGNSAAEGHDTQNAFILANEKFGGGLITPVFEDDECSPKGGVNAVQKLINISKVNLIAGFTCSGPLLAAVPIVQKSKVVTIGVGTASPLITNSGEYIFRTCPSDAIGAVALAHYIKTHHDSVGILTEETEFCRGFSDVLQKAGKREGLSVTEESYISSESDFKSILLKLKQRNISSLVLNTQSEKNLITAYKQLREMGWSVPVLGNFYPGSAEFLRTFGKNADGIVFSDIPSAADLKSKNARDFLDEFEKRFGKPQSVEAIVLTTASAVQIIRQAIEMGPNLLENLNNGHFNTVIGPLSFDENGDIKGFSKVIKRIENGAVVTIQP